MRELPEAKPKSERVDASRAEIQAVLAPYIGDAKVSLRRMSFMDLARDEAYVLRVAGFGGMLTPEQHAAQKPALEAMKAVANAYLYKGCTILLG